MIRFVARSLSAIRTFRVIRPLLLFPLSQPDTCLVDGIPRPTPGDRIPVKSAFQQGVSFRYQSRHAGRAIEAVGLDVSLSTLSSVAIRHEKRDAS
jgi:hypothetical protein